MDIPTQFCWPHLWDAEDFDKLRNKCCLHFGLDRTQPDGKSKFDTKLVKFNFDTNQPFLIFMSEKYDNKLCHLIPTFVTMSRDLQDKFVLISDLFQAGLLHYQVYNFCLLKQGQHLDMILKTSFVNPFHLSTLAMLQFVRLS